MADCPDCGRPQGLDDEQCDASYYDNEHRPPACAALLVVRLRSQLATANERAERAEEELRSARNAFRRLDDICTAQGALIDGLLPDSEGAGKGGEGG